MLASCRLLIARFIRAGITKDQWPVHMKEVYRILKPGTGWIQCGEINPRLRCDDGSCPEDAAVFRVCNFVSRTFCSSIVSRIHRTEDH